MPKFPKNKGYKSPVKHHSMSVDSKKVKAVHYHDPKKGIVTVKKDRPKINPAPYAPFKMKHASGNPMKANFKSAFKQMDPMTPQPQDIKNPASPMMKPLVGKQKNLPEHLKKEILAAPPIKQLDNKKEERKIVRRMKKIETKLAKNGSLPAGEKKKLRDELLELSYTAAGQMYTDTGGIKRSPAKKNKKTRSERLVEKEKSLKRKHTTAIAEGKEKKS